MISIQINTKSVFHVRSSRKHFNIIDLKQQKCLKKFKNNILKFLE